MESEGVTLSVGIITFIGVLLNACLVHRGVKQGRLTESIVIQRISWSDKLRESFLNFNASIRGYKNSKMQDTLIKARNENDRISLLLRTNEKYPDLLIKANEKLMSKVQNEDVKSVEGSIKTVLYLQRIILKSEWKRIKKEAQKGRLLGTRKVKKIYDKMEEELKESQDFTEEDIKEIQENIKQFNKNNP